MRVLHVSNFYYDRGGDCTYLFSLMNLLKKKGHKNIIFSMRHPKNFDSEYSRYFVSYINYVDELKKKDISSAVKVLFRSVYSLEAKRKIERLVKDEKPDIAHLQNIHHHITPSILYILKKYNIPIVWTLHDYTLICPNTSFLAHGKICERCKKRKYFWPLIVRCKKGSFAASLMAAIEATIHKIMGVNNLIDVFLTPSEFLRNKLIEYGFNAEKIVCLNNFVDIKCDNGNGQIENNSYYLYIGRLTEEKGIKTLIDAAVKVNRGWLKIIGDGPIKEELISYAKSKGGNKVIKFLGHKNCMEMLELLKKCSFVVIPSEWYENFPYAVIEAFTHGKPVIGSRTGGIPELVKDNVTGLTFEPGNSDDLSYKIKYLIDDTDRVAMWGKNARIYVEKELNAEKHYQRLIEIYSSVLGHQVDR